MIGYKTDFLAVRLVRHWKPGILCDLPHLFFFVLPHRHQRMFQLVLGQTVESIGLILRRCHRSFEGISAIWQLGHSGIMPGGDVVSPDL